VKVNARSDEIIGRSHPFLRALTIGATDGKEARYRGDPEAGMVPPDRHRRRADNP